MKRFQFFVAVFVFLTLTAPFAFAAGGISGLRSHTHASAGQGGVLGNLPITGTLSSTKACATGYTRTTPNYCSRNLEFSSHGPVTFASCTQLNALGSVTDAVMVKYRVEIAILSANSIGSNQYLLAAYAPTDTTCASSAQLSARHAAREEVAASGVQLARYSVTYDLRTGTTGRTYVQGTSTAGANTAEFFVMGYYD